MRRFAGFWVAAVMLAATMTVAAGAARSESVLQRGNRYEPASLDPHKYNTSYEASIILDLFEGLTVFGPDAVPKPGLATSWSSTPDGKTWTFTLRKNAQWSDGAPLDAEDVVFSFRRLMDPKTGGVYASLLYGVKNGRAVNTGAIPPEQLGVTAAAPDKIVITLDAPLPYLPELLSNAFLAIVPAQAIKKSGAAWVKPENAVSSGAFVLKEWTPQNRIVLARNARYYDAAHVALDSVIYYPTSDLNAAAVRFRGGDLDVQFDFPASQLDLMRSQFPAATHITPVLTTYYLALNTALPKLSDVRVRRALSMAIDRDVIVEKVLRTGEIAATGLVPPTVTGYKPARMAFVETPSEERLKQARALLAEAGYGPSNPLKLSYSHSNVTELKRIGVTIAAMWKRIGVETTLLGTEGKVHFANLRQGAYEVGYAGWSADFNDAATFLSILQSTSTGSNYSRYKNAMYDALVAQVAQTAQPSVRAELLHQAEGMALSDQPVIPLMVGVTKILVSSRVAGWQDNAAGFNLSRYLSVDRGQAPPQ